MEKKFKLLFLLVIMVIPICINSSVYAFAEKSKENVEFLDTSNIDNILESSHWTSEWREDDDWRGANALLNKSEKAFGWSTALNKIENEYLGYDFKKPTKIDFYEIEAVHDSSNLNGGYMVKSWEFQGYANGTWETLDKVDNAKKWTSTTEVRRFPVTCNKEYSKFRVLVKDTFDHRSAEIGRLRFGKDPNTSTVILDIEPVKEKIKLNEEVTADLTINNITQIAAEDIRIKYDNEKLKFIGFEEVDGIKLIKDIQDAKNGELRVILSSKGEANIVNAKKALLKLKFKAIKQGEALVDVTKGRVSDGIEMEKDLTDEQCDEGKIIIEEIKDVNASGEFTLLDLAIDARHLNKNPKAQELSKYNTDISINDAIDEDDLLEIGKLMIDNPNYEPNKY